MIGALCVWVGAASSAPCTGHPPTHQPTPINSHARPQHVTHLRVRLQRHERARAHKILPSQRDVEPRGAVVLPQSAAVVSLFLCRGMGCGLGLLVGSFCLVGVCAVCGVTPTHPHISTITIHTHTHAHFPPTSPPTKRTLSSLAALGYRLRSRRKTSWDGLCASMWRSA